MARFVAAVGVVKIDKCSVCVIECPPQTPGSGASPLRGAGRGDRLLWAGIPS